MKQRLLILGILLGFTQTLLFAQTQIELDHADRVTPGNANNVYHFQGNVRFKHEGAIMTCDHAYQYNNENRVEAFGNVRILQGDTLSLYGDSLFYDGDSKLARLRGNVRLKEKDMTLVSNMLDYDLNTKIASYYSGGTIKSSSTQNVLTSEIGSYHSPSKTLNFRNNVVLTNPEYVMECDTLQYNTASESAYFLGPSTITSNTNFIYCENGWYNTRSEQAIFYQNARLHSDGQILTGDSLYYDRKISSGEAYCNVTLNDTVNHVIIQGEYGTTNEIEQHSMVTGNALLTKVFKTDSLFLHGDSLVAFKDSLNYNVILAYNHVKFLKSDLQGKCDSLSYREADSTITMHYEPVLWFGGNQITGEVIDLITYDGILEELRIYNSSFIISEADSLSNYNQIKGKNMIGYFKNDSLHKVEVMGNGEAIYFAKKDDGTPIGMVTAECSDILILVANNEISSITFIKEPDSITYPDHDINPNDRLLKGFHWESGSRPFDIDSIFTW